MGDEIKREFTAEDRSDLEERGLAMPGGAYPIETVGDLRNAIHAFGRAKDPEKTRAWIIKRAHDLGQEDLLPEGWVDAEDDQDDDDMKASPMSSEHKVVPVSGFKVLDEDLGIVEAIVSVTGIEDRVKDTIEPGAYTKTLAERTPRGCWGHDWNTPISKTLEIKELMPGDPGLPKALRNGQPWPTGAGALQVKTQFNLETQRGREAYSDVKFFGEDQEWSIGYNVPPGGSKTDPKTGRRSIKQLVLHEYSPVLHGAMPEAVTQSVKAAQQAYAVLVREVKDDTSAPVDDVTLDEPQVEVEISDGPALSEEDVDLLFGAVDALTEDDLLALHADPEVLADADAGEAGEEKTALRFTEWAGEYGAEVKKGNAETLRRYWAEGEGAAKIRWGQSGDFDRCVREVDKYMPGRAKGYCNLLHNRALGYYPATHAAMDRAGKDVTGGSYPLAVQPGLAGADGEPDVEEVAEPGEPCPECEQDTDEQGRCMNPDCEKFGMAVKWADLSEEEKAARRDKQRHGGWLWAGRGSGGGGKPDAPDVDKPDPDAEARRAKIREEADQRAAALPKAERDEKARLATIKANRASDKAGQIDRDYGPKHAENEHLHAREMHRRAEFYHRAAGDKEQEKHHRERAAEHDRRLAAITGGPGSTRGKADEVDITLDTMQAVRLFDDAEEKGYIRKQPHGGWLWAGWHGSPDTRGRSTHADFARLGGAHVPEGWDANDRNRRVSMRGAAQALNAEARAGTGSQPRTLTSKAPKQPFTRSGLELTQALDDPDGGRLQRDGRTYRVDNVRKGVFERWKVTDVETGHSIEVNGPGSTETVQRRASRRMEAFSAAVHDLRKRQANPASAVDTEAAPSVQRHKVQVGQQLRNASRARRHEIPATHADARHASQNLALADTFRPMNRLKDQQISDEIAAMRRRLASERPARGSLRSNLIRSRIADLAREQRRRSGKDDGTPLALDEFGPEEFAAQERARVLALQALWDDAKAMPPMGEYERWSDEQLGHAAETLVDTLNGDDVPEPFARALQVELEAITVAQSREPVAEKVDVTREVLEASRLLADLD